MWRDVILANISTMLPCTGAARSGSYRGAKILGKSREPMTKLNFGLAVHSLIKSRSKHKVLLVFYCSMHLSCFSPPPKEVMQKCTITYDSDPEQHPQTKLLQSLLWLLLKRWNCHLKGTSHPTEHWLEEAKSCPIASGEHWGTESWGNHPGAAFRSEVHFLLFIYGRPICK